VKTTRNWRRNRW